jgi:hypothetical protein
MNFADEFGLIVAFAFVPFSSLLFVPSGWRHFTMKFLMTYQQNPDAPPPTPQQMAAIGALTERNMKAGVLVMTGGLVRPTRGIQIRCDGGKVSITDGPFAETKELIDGFALVEVASRDEAIKLASEFMQVAGDGTGEILQVFDPGGPPPR